MNMSARLQLRQSQSLVITPQLMQAIRLLQMSAPELEDFIDREIEENPLLSRDESGEGSVDTGDRASEGAGETQEAATAESAGGDLTAEAAATSASDADVAREDLYPDDDRSLSGSSDFSRAGSRDASEFPDEDSYAASAPTLLAVLEQQIDTVFQGATDRMIALTLLGEIDEAGYLRAEPEMLAANLEVTLEDVLRVLSRCQSFEPAGVFARSLKECLKIQLAEFDRYDPAMAALIDNLELLATGNRAALCNACGVDMEDMIEMIAEVRALDPKPGMRYLSEPVALLVPDIVVRPGPEGAWLIDLNDAVLPRLLIDRRYHAEVKGRRRDQATEKFLSECLQKATWLEKSLDQRARTLLAVSAEIVRWQDRFLHDGAAYLKPLTLRMVADEIGMHESTVSRAVANKAMATPRGIFPLKAFFSVALAATDGGDSHSAEAVRQRIRVLVAGEGDRVLSDDQIVAILKDEGIVIARRTVAKYREAMGIPSSVNRRRMQRQKLAS
ncbi:RNA polymerase sigma-54 factor [Rhodopseudomonas julia]|uniref:RNA polymerase sigma-54 factor n=1 Tax=Rhodopseudomonas julia TaxID=200617 RepID=A0ABU0C425_9BRAD|nr:RNA polymerase factor sigma-54 [Rhodopseudomonas julia]MDQ0325258.1 RNA polymerase sigma-54 factor [Rhodopseudomonas julia]